MKAEVNRLELIAACEAFLKANNERIETQREVLILDVCDYNHRGFLARLFAGLPLFSPITRDKAVEHLKKREFHGLSEWDECAYEGGRWVHRVKQVHKLAKASTSTYVVLEHDESFLGDWL